MRRLIAAALLAAVVGCGGGGSSTSTTAPATVSDRTDLLFGYFGTCPTCQAETADHVNMLFESPWDGLQVVVDDMTRARLPTVLFTPQDVVALRALFTALRNANVLRYVVALYPQDEPDNAGMTDAQVVAMAATQRQVAAEFVELAGVKLATIYGSQGRNTPGLAAFDWTGFDDYDRGESIFANGEYDAFRARLGPGQRALLVPGGGSPWRTLPDAFVAKANADAKVVAVVPFIWRDRPEGAGIRSNGMAAAYIAAGKRIKRAP